MAILSAVCILRFSSPGTQPCRSPLPGQELASCFGLPQASSQASTLSPSPHDKQCLKVWVWLKMQPKPEDEMCLYLGFTAVQWPCAASHSKLWFAYFPAPCFSAPALSSAAVPAEVLGCTLQPALLSVNVRPQNPSSAPLLELLCYSPGISSTLY